MTLDPQIGTEMLKWAGNFSKGAKTPSTTTTTTNTRTVNFHRLVKIDSIESVLCPFDHSFMKL